MIEVCNIHAHPDRGEEFLTHLNFKRIQINFRIVMAKNNRFFKKLKSNNTLMVRQEQTNLS